MRKETDVLFGGVSSGVGRDIVIITAITMPHVDGWDE